MTGHLIFSAILIACAIWMILYLRKKGRRCRWCMAPTAKVDRLSEPECTDVGQLIREARMPGRASDYEICPSCRRLFDRRWFGRDWEMQDRWCACGWELKVPWSVDTGHLREAVADLPRAVIQRLLDIYTREEVAKLLGGYVDMQYRHAKLPEGHALLVCETPLEE